MYKIDSEDESHTENENMRRTVIMNRGIQRNNNHSMHNTMHNDFMNEHMNVHGHEHNGNNMHIWEARFARLEQQIASGREEFIKLRKSVEIYQTLANSLALIDIDKNGNDGHGYMSRFLDVFNYIVDFYKMSEIENPPSSFIHFIEIMDYDSLKINKITYEETTNPVAIVVTRKMHNMNRNFYIEVMFLRDQNGPDSEINSDIYQLSIYSKTLDSDLLKLMLSKCIEKTCPFIETSINSKTNGITIRLHIEGSMVCELLIYFIKFINKISQEIISIDIDDLNLGDEFLYDVFASKELIELNKDYLDQREASDIEKAIALSINAERKAQTEHEDGIGEAEAVAEAEAEGVAEAVAEAEGVAEAIADGIAEAEAIPLHATCLPGNFNIEDMFHMAEQRSLDNTLNREISDHSHDSALSREASAPINTRQKKRSIVAPELSSRPPIYPVSSIYRTINMESNDDDDDDDENQSYIVEEVDVDDNNCDDEVVEIDGNAVIIDGNTITINVSDDDADDDADADGNESIDDTLKGWPEMKRNSS